VHKLLRTAEHGRGMISCLELAAVQDRPGLFSWLPAELSEELREVGDPEKSKLCFFLDEAQLLFTGASKTFLDSITQTVRLIRSKGVGVYFVTPTPKDGDDEVLAQLGNRVQHALRAFTPDDTKALQATVRTSQVRVLRPRAASPAAGDRGGGGGDPVRERCRDAGRAHEAQAAGLAGRACRRRRHERHGLAAGREVRHAGRRAERTGAAGGTPGAEAGRRGRGGPRAAGRAVAGGGASGGGAGAIGEFPNSRTGKQL
jgi:hypothetical protein